MLYSCGLSEMYGLLRRSRACWSTLEEKGRQDRGRSTVMWWAGEGVRGPSRNTERKKEERATQGRTSQGVMGSEQCLLMPKFV